MRAFLPLNISAKSSVVRYGLQTGSFQISNMISQIWQSSNRLTEVLRFLILWNTNSRLTNSIQMKSLRSLSESFAIRVIAFASRVYASRCEVAGLDFNWKWGHIKSPKAWFDLLQFYDLLTFAIRVIAFVSKVCASWWDEVAGLDLNCGGGHFKSPKAWFEVLQFYDLLTHQQHPNEKSTFTIVFICHSCYRFCL